LNILGLRLNLKKVALNIVIAITVVIVTADAFKFVGLERLAFAQLHQETSNSAEEVFGGA